MNVCLMMLCYSGPCVKIKEDTIAFQRHHDDIDSKIEDDD